MTLMNFEKFFQILYYRNMGFLDMKFFKYDFQIKIIHLSNFTVILKKILKIIL